MTCIIGKSILVLGGGGMVGAAVCDPERCTITISRPTPHQVLVFSISGNRRHPPTLELPSPFGKTDEVRFEEFLIPLVLRPTFP